MDFPESFDTKYGYSAVSLILEVGHKDKNFDEDMFLMHILG